MKHHTTDRCVEQYIAGQHLFGKADKVLVALSGGADSVALLRILLNLGYQCEAAHCNFHLRGEESDRDEMFVRLLCNTLQVKLHTTDFNTHEYAGQQKISIEMAARELRYGWFNELAETAPFDVVAVAHHRDDSIETMMLNLIRGTGINGLLGIRPKNERIVRPLLCVGRGEVVDYLNAIGQTFVTDSTNLHDEYTRNKIRLNLLPVMEEINPSVKEGMMETSNHLHHVAKLYQHAIAEEKQRVMKNGEVCISALLNSPSPEAVLYEILYPLGFNPPQIKEVFTALKGESGKQFYSAQGWRAIKDRELLLLAKTAQTEEALPPFQLAYKEVEMSSHFSFCKDGRFAYFDADKLRGEFSLRKCRKGDYFVPFGMKGRKLISDFLTDQKFSILKKEQQWLLCSGQDVAWVVGVRSDNRFRVDEATHRVVVVELIRL